MKTSLISKIFPSVSPGVTKITLFIFKVTSSRAQGSTSQSWTARISSQVQKSDNSILQTLKFEKTDFRGEDYYFQIFRISKIVYLALLTMIPNLVIEGLKQIQKILLLGNKKPKMKHI